jgi:hypothetical protein
LDLGLSRLDGVQGLNDKLDYTIALEFRHPDKLGNSSQNHPEGWMRKEFHDQWILRFNIILNPCACKNKKIRVPYWIPRYNPFLFYSTTYPTLEIAFVALLTHS